MLVLFLLLVPLAAAQVTGSSLISAPIAAGGNGTIIRITNDLGPTAVFVQFGATSVIFDITYYAADSAALASLTALQPTSATIEQDEITLALVGGTSIPADDLGGSCKLVTFTASSPRPPCQPFTYTPSPSAPSTRSATDAAYVQVSVPEETTICVNDWCSNPLYYALPAISPQTFSDLGNGVIYDATQGLMWQQSLLPGSYPYDSENGNNFPTINNAAQACYALQLGGFEDWRLPTRSELHRWADHSVSPAQNSSFFPVSTDTEDEAYWTVIRTKVNDYLGIYFMQYGGDGGITYNGDVSYSSSQRARCVRTVINKLPPLDRFAVQGSGEAALDHYTGLVWQVNVLDTVYPADTGATPAIEYCEDLVLNGQDDWRLPNNKEMSSFMDESRAGPAWNITVFPNFQGATGWWWCGNPYVAAQGRYWGWSGGDGVSFVNISPGRGRCVRSSFDASSCGACPPSPSGAPPPPPGGSGSSKGLSKGAKTGIAIGVILIVAIIAVGGFFGYKYWKQGNRSRLSTGWKISV